MWPAAGTLARRLPTSADTYYVLTADGVRIAVFCPKVCNRLLVPLTAADQAQAPPELRAALAPITHLMLAEKTWITTRRRKITT